MVMRSPASCSAHRRPPPHGRAVAAVALLLACLVMACSSGLPRPPAGRTPVDAMIEVPYPPPPARVEVVPAQAEPLTVWLDGTWEWDGKSWKWAEGAWMRPPANAYYTPWKTLRHKDGRLFFARASWRGADGRPLDSPGSATCPAPPPPRRAGELARQ